DDEELQGEVANACANLPRDQRILVGRVIADQQHRFGLVQLVHRKQGIVGVFAERGQQAGVVGGAVMINVGGAECFARQLLEQIVFFVWGAIGADEADRIAAVLGVNILQPGSSGLCGF